jgi:hypothetical protein
VGRTLTATGGFVLQCTGRGPARRPAQAVVLWLEVAMAWNANDASRQAAHKGLQQQQRQQRFYRSNQQRAARQMRDLMAQYRARRGFSRQQRGGQEAAMGAGIPAFEPGYSSEPILDISAHEAQGDGLRVILPGGFDAIVGQAWPAAATLAPGWPSARLWRTRPEVTTAAVPPRRSHRAGRRTACPWPHCRATCSSPASPAPGRPTRACACFRACTLGASPSWSSSQPNANTGNWPSRPAIGPVRGEVRPDRQHFV